MDLVTTKCRIEGVAPLLMHNVRALDPLNPYTKALAEITSKRDKTDADHEELRWREWAGGIYYADDMGPYVPSEWIESTIRDGARTSRRGKDVVAGLYCPDERYALIGAPRVKSLRELYDSPGYLDVRPVKVGMARVMRTRPRFNTWALEFSIVWDSSVLNEGTVKEAIQVAGLRKGLGDYRPKYGRFVLKDFAS